MKKSKKQLIKELKPYWKKINKAQSKYYEELANIEERMAKKTGIEDIEIFWSDGIAGIGNYSRTIDLIHRKELEDE